MAKITKVTYAILEISPIAVKEPCRRMKSSDEMIELSKECHFKRAHNMQKKHMYTTHRY